MNLLFTFDDNYSQYAGVTICSFLANNPGAHIIYVISDHISEGNQTLLREICTVYKSMIYFFFINTELTKDFPVGEGTINPTLTIATYFRLFMADVLPQSVDKILYIDCDIIVDGSLSELWNTPFQEGKCLAALEELPSLSIDGCARMNYPASFSYFNAGVLLIHLDRLRSLYSVKKASEFIRQHYNSIRYHDQDVLNALLYDKKQFFDLQYNVMDTCLIRNAELPARYQQQRDSIYHPKIIHFTGYFKPWHSESKNPYTYKYFEYLAKTAWKGDTPKSKFSNRQTKYAFYLKYWIKMLLDALNIKHYRYISLPPTSSKL